MVSALTAAACAQAAMAVRAARSRFSGHITMPYRPQPKTTRFLDWVGSAGLGGIDELLATSRAQGRGTHQPHDGTQITQAVPRLLHCLTLSQIVLTNCRYPNKSKNDVRTLA